MTQPSTSTILVSDLRDQFDNHHGFSLSPTGTPLTQAEVNTGDFVVQDLAQRPAAGGGVVYEATLANGQSVVFPTVPEVVIFR
jgi:hypothetical protein